MGCFFHLFIISKTLYNLYAFINVKFLKSIFRFVIKQTFQLLMATSNAVEPKSTSDILKVVAIGALSLGLNYLLFGKLLNKNDQLPAQPVLRNVLSVNIDQQKSELDVLTSSKIVKVLKKDQNWGSVKLITQDKSDPLLKQLRLMDSLLYQVSRINNLIVDLQLTDFKPHPNFLVGKTIKKNKQQPFICVESLVTPGQFIIKQCKFSPSNTLQLQKKFMRAGPRGSQFFYPKQVRADIVCLGGVSPGMNTVVRQLTIFLKDSYKVASVTGVKNSFRGYYEKKFVDLNYNIVETIHHFGGCFLGLAQGQFHLQKIIDSLIERKINQLYLIGANKTLKSCQALHREIKKRKLAIAVCVLLKGINRDIPIFDGCFGFQTAVEQSSKIVEKAYAFSHSHQNGVALVKLPGYNSGFLAAYTVLSTINSNFCLVPEFQFDVYGPHGLLQSIMWRIRNKGSCTIVYAEGAQKALRDCCISKSHKWQSITEFDNFLRSQIEKKIKDQNIGAYHVGLFNAIEVSRSSPANSLDTKLCCQIAQACVMGIMAGYTNFAVGHLANKSGMISIDQLVKQESSFTKLKEHDDIWQQTIMTTGQPRLLNDDFTIRTPL